MHRRARYYVDNENIFLGRVVHHIRYVYIAHRVQFLLTCSSHGLEINIGVQSANICFIQFWNDL